MFVISSAMGWQTLDETTDEESDGNHAERDHDDEGGRLDGRK
jgi:hypothetical protein